ncbi:DNA photolyase family protein [Leeia sp. TBRC 13508]|uniref:DNA photolyase family protein n=1 Tax=Leeia speluncae TaxID=2884804 RepID=A0ABS8D5F4_9NEIS|nr:deoxyribodipyrimidine photo-lyase [Leeia speluncae]MCB6183424.1 DNA photolyase family protein [Leeia speluncae]
MTRPVILWFRRDLRLADHAALYHAIKTNAPILPVFVFDTTILSQLSKEDRRVTFIWESCLQLHEALIKQGSKLHILQGDPRTCIPEFAQAVGATAVFCNRDYEPAAIERDQAVAEQLSTFDCLLCDFKDQVIFEKDEVLTQAGKPYTVFTPYKNAWLKKVTPFYLRAYPSKPNTGQLAKVTGYDWMPLEALGFEPQPLATKNVFSGEDGAEKLWQDFIHRLPFYHQTRDFPSIKGPSYLSIHLRFGTVSIRQLANFAMHDSSSGANTWLSELIWRDFYHQILWHFPHVVHSSFKAEYQNLAFPNNQAWLDAWKKGETGYPIVDAAMRQLSQSGYMHNRLRMVAASFLVKDLLVDWRLGEAWFAEQLLDFDLAANSGGWQWSASTGCDAQPYFRIFNPISQSEKFDAEGKFIRRYVPELANLSNKWIHAPWLADRQTLEIAGVTLGKNYPKPIVDHATQREAALALFKIAKG